MSEQNTLNTIARIIVDAFDIDIHIYTMQLLRKLRETSFGMNFVAWAENNPTAFMNLLRGASAVVQRLPKNDSLAIETITDHLQRLPVNVWETTTGVGRNTGKSSFSDEEFRKKYEEATEGLSLEELSGVAKLRRNRLREWVDSPPNMRKVFLKTWHHEPKRMSKAIIYWGIAFTWLLINLLFIGMGEFSVFESDYERYQKADWTSKSLIETIRSYKGLSAIPEKPQTNWMRWVSWRFFALYSFVFCPFYSVWVVYKAITR